MRTLRLQLPIGIVCALLGVLLVTQFRTQRLTYEDIPRSAGDQATYISQLYDNNRLLRRQISDLNEEVALYRPNSTGEENLTALTRELQSLRIANGQVAVVGPGVSVLVDGDLTVFDLQDLVNELRDAGAEAVAVNRTRVIGRSAISERQTDGTIMIDGEILTRPYRLEAIGSPDTLTPALERQGGLLALLEARDPPLTIRVYRHNFDDLNNRIKLPPTKLQFPSLYSKAVQP